MIKLRYEIKNNRIYDNEVDDFVDDVVDRLNTQDFNKNELINIKQQQYERIIELSKTNKFLSNELTKNNTVKQDHIETCCGIPIFDIPQLKQDNEKLKQKLAEYEKAHYLNEEEFQNYCSFKHIEPEIRGCLDREKEYQKQLIRSEDQNKRVLEKLDLIIKANQDLEKENRELHTTINLSIPNQIAMKDEIEKLHTCRDKRIDELVAENNKLEQQLADAEKEISNYQHELEVYKHNDNIYASKIGKFANKAKQEKLDFAINCLREIREYVQICNSADMIEGKVRLDISKKIRNKIEELRGNYGTNNN